MGSPACRCKLTLMYTQPLPDNPSSVTDHQSVQSLTGNKKTASPDKTMNDQLSVLCRYDQQDFQQG